MLIDVISSSSYLTFNVNVAHVIGLVNAVYCAELLDIYNKARKKKKLDDNNYFIVNRDYVKNRTSIKLDEQYLCDASLSKIGLVITSKENPDKICFDVEQFLKIIAEEDSKTLDTITKKILLPKNKQDAKELRREKKKLELKAAIDVDNVKLTQALNSWIDVVFESKNMIVDTVKDFQKTLMSYCCGDVNKAIEIVNIARLQTWTNCVWAIENYEKAQALLSKDKTKVKTTKPKIASNTNLSNKKF